MTSSSIKERARVPTEQDSSIIRTDQPCKTLVVCPIGLGNFVMATPALSLLSNQIGRANLHLLALKPAIKQMAEASDLFGMVPFWDVDREGFRPGLALIGSLRKQQYDYSIALFPTGDWKFGLFALLAGARTRVGFAYPNSRIPERLQTVSLPLDPLLHDTDQNYRFADHLLGTPRRVVSTLNDAPLAQADLSLQFPFPSSHKQVDELTGQRYFVCHPGSSAERGMRDKRLPAHAFAEVIRRIYAQFGLRCILIGGPEEADLRTQIQADLRDETLNITSSNLNELAALIAHSQLYVGNDSGLMHVAVALGKRCIAFFGPTDDRRNGPYYGTEPGRHLIVRRDDLTCSPCWTLLTVGANPACIYGDTRCLTDLSIDKVWPRIASYLGGVLH